MSNPKVFEYAKEIGMTPLALMDKIREWHIPVKSHMAELDPETLAQLKSHLSDPKKPAEEPKKKTVARKAAPAAAAPAAKPVAAKAPLKKATAAEAADAKAAATPAGKAAVVRRKGAVAANAPAAELKAEQEPQAAETVTSHEELPEVVEVAAAPVAAPVATPAPAAPAPIAAAPVAAAAAPAAPVAVAPAASVVAAAENGAPQIIIQDRTDKPGEIIKTPARKKEVVVGSSGVSSTSTVAPRRNIVGRMDLSRVQAPNNRPVPTPGGGGGIQGFSGPRPAGGGFAGGPSRPIAGRGLRAGFVSATAPESAIPMSSMMDDSRKKTLDKKVKRIEGGAGGTGKEEEEIQFNAVEFRKRELVFQPKKKKTLMGRDSKKTVKTQSKASKRVLKINGTMRLGDAAMEMGLKAPQLMKVLMANGVTASINTSLDFDTLALIVPDFGWEAQNVQQSAQGVLEATAFGNMKADKIIRPPVVTIMGHVDHGKTSLLDAIRSAKVAAGEAGGITQHIGAYSVTLPGGAPITFLDTPGHEAFTAMRARGANATDIAVIVVAADDGMMPQTQEAISHAKAAGVPIIVAINKMDKPGANPEKIKQQLTEMELVPEEWGGTTIYVPVSAMKKTGLTELLEQIRLVAEMAELKANPERSGTGIVIESKLEKGRGPVATLLVKDGTVRVGQSIVAGSVRGRVRSLMNDKGERVQSVGPGFPAEVLGLEDTPKAGDQFDVVVDEVTAEKVAGLRREQELGKNSTEVKKLSLDEIFSKVNKGDVKELGIILKADVHGSLEAVTGMIGKMTTIEVKTRILHSGVGGINESDVLLASSSKGIVIGFNVRPDGGASARAKQLGVDIRCYTIVYELVDDLKKAMTGLLRPDVVEKVMGRAEVRNTFGVPKIGTIAGCFIVDGKIQRSNMVRLVRDGKIIYDGKIASLKRFKDDAKEVAQGFECGLGIENYNDVKVGDVIEAYTKEEVLRELSAPTASV